MPNYYGEIMQTYWGKLHKNWKVRYKAARVIFDEFQSLVMTDCIFRGYTTNVKGHPEALIEGRLDLNNSSPANGSIITLEEGKPPIFRWDGKEPLTVSQIIGTVWLNADGTINGSHLKDSPIKGGGKNQFHKYAVKWDCEWRRGGTLVQATQVTAIHQWNAVRYLLRLRQTTRRYGVLTGDVLTYDDNRGNVVIVRPSIEKVCG